MEPVDIAVDSARNVYVLSWGDYAFKIALDGTITKIIDGTGDGTNIFDERSNIEVDPARNVYVSGALSDNVFKISPDGATITQIIDSTGDGTNILDRPNKIATDPARNVYVLGIDSDNVFKIAASDGSITEIINRGNDTLVNPIDMVVDSAGNVYVLGFSSNNLFKITPEGVITEIMNADGGLRYPRYLAIDSADNLYVPASSFYVPATILPTSLFKIAPNGTTTTVIDGTGDGTGDSLQRTGNYLKNISGMVFDSAGNLYVLGGASYNVFVITPDGTIAEIFDGVDFDGTDSGGPIVLDDSIDIKLDSAGNIYVVWSYSENVIKIPAIIDTVLR